MRPGKRSLPIWSHRRVNLSAPSWSSPWLVGWFWAREHSISLQEAQLISLHWQYCYPDLKTVLCHWLLSIEMCVSMVIIPCASAIAPLTAFQRVGALTVAPGSLWAAFGVVLIPPSLPIACGLLRRMSYVHWCRSRRLLDLRAGGDSISWVGSLLTASCGVYPPTAAPN